MTATTTPTAIRLYNLAHAQAMTKVGKDVFRFQNDTVKHGLVAAEIVNVILAQDEDIDPARVLQLMADMAQENAAMYLNS